MPPGALRLGVAMGKLAGRGLPGRLRRSGNRLREGRRDGGVSMDRSKNWYNTAEWKRMRERVLERDGNVCQQTGVALIGKYPAPNSAVVDHIEPHRGDRSRFFDERNLQAVSKAYHDGEKQRLEVAARRA